GFTLPFAVLRAVLKEPSARRRYEEIALTQLAVTVAISVGIFYLMPSLWRSALRKEDAAAGIAQLLSTVYAVATGAEWATVAVSRDFHDDLSLRASYLTGVPGDPLAAPPRVRLDLGWLWTKVRRKIRELLLILSGFPVLL